MNELLKRLGEERNRIYEQMKAITDLAASEKRDLSADEAARFDQGSKDMDELRARIDQVMSVEKMNREAEENLRKAIGDDAERRIPDVPDINADLRAFLLGEKRSLTVGPEKRDLAAGTATAGGNTIPRDFYGQLIEHLVETSGVLMAGPTVFTTSSGDSFDVPITTSHGAAGQEVAENSTIPESDPAFGKRTLGAYTYSQLVQVPNGLIQDTAVDLTGYLARACGRNVGLALAPRLITGTGSSQPSGILTGATLGVTGGTGVTGKFTYDDLVNLYHSVIAPYRNNPSAGWLMRDSSLAAVRLLKDGAGSYIFAAGTAGQPDTILGKPVFTDPNVAATAVSAKSVIFGDVSAYWVRYAGPVRFERSDDYAFGTDQVSFRCILRADAVLVDQTGAIKYFAGAAS